MYIYIYTYICIFMYTYLCKNLYVYMHTYINVKCMYVFLCKIYYTLSFTYNFMGPKYKKYTKKIFK